MNKRMRSNFRKGDLFKLNYTCDMKYNILYEVQVFK